MVERRVQRRQGVPELGGPARLPLGPVIGQRIGARIAPCAGPCSPSPSPR
jgi:hypothetical protein